MYKYEMHCHTLPVSSCARVGVRETVEYYKSLGYDGVFITNHFLDGNINIDRNESYDNKIKFYFGDYEEALVIGKELGIKVFDGVEMSYKGTDFLVYGLHKEWYLKNPQIMDMKIKDRLNFLRENGAFVVQAHPFREASYIDHIRLFPRCIDAVEVINVHHISVENEMAKIYATKYNLKESAGSDNHLGSRQTKLAGLQFETPVNSVEELIERVKKDEYQLFELI